MRRWPTLVIIVVAVGLLAGLAVIFIQFLHLVGCMIMLGLPAECVGDFAG